MWALTRDCDKWRVLVAAPNPPRSATARKLRSHETLRSIASRRLASASRRRASAA